MRKRKREGKNQQKMFLLRAKRLFQFYFNENENKKQFIAFSLRFGRWLR